MRSILEFTLPEESEEYMDALRGSRYHGVLQELDNHLRAKLKYEDLPSEQAKIYEEIRSKLVELCSDSDVTIWS